MRGKCLCGAVEFEITGATPKLYQCHCALCRKQGGSSSNTATVSRAPWDTAALAGAQFETMPELREFIRMLHGGVGG